MFVRYEWEGKIEEDKEMLLVGRNSDAIVLILHINYQLRSNTTVTHRT